MLRYRLRTLLILLALLPPLLWIGWGKYQAWREERERARAEAQARYAAEMRARASKLYWTRIDEAVRISDMPPNWRPSPKSPPGEGP